MQSRVQSPNVLRGPGLQEIFEYLKLHFLHFESSFDQFKHSFVLPMITLHLSIVFGVYD